MEERVSEALETGHLNLRRAQSPATRRAAGRYLTDPAALEGCLDAALAAGAPVAELDLSSCGLAALPPWLTTRPELARGLRRLTVKYNALTRLDSALLAQLPRLEALDAEGNQIAAVGEGELPALPHLRSLNLTSNGLAALPADLAACASLEALLAANNPLAHLPDGLGACPALQLLDVSGCRLAALPASLAQCRRLQRLFCQNNELPRVPPALGHLRGLREWNLRANRLPLKYEQAREKGLARFLAFLREEEDIERLQEIERNRPVGVQAGPATVYRTTPPLADALHDVAAGEAAALAGFPWVRHGAAACVAGRAAYVWGGCVAREGRKTAELLLLDLDTMRWRVQPTRGDRPGPRTGHVLVADPAGRQLFAFGGRKESGRRCADLFCLSLDTWAWTAVKHDRSAPGPPPREQAAAAVADGKLLLFGGRTNGARLNDLWAFDLSAWAWQQLPASGTAPAPRQGAAACVAGGQLWVQGGSSNFVQADVFAYSLAQQEWRAVSIEGDGQVAARASGHTIAADGAGGLWLFGGTDAMGGQAGGLLRLRQKARSPRHEWARTELELPPARCRLPLFDQAADSLVLVQCGHPLHAKGGPTAEQAERGDALWDSAQVVHLPHIQERALRPEEEVHGNPKRERIQQASAAAARLPPAFTIPSPSEQQLLATAAAFRQRWAAGAVAAAEAGEPLGRLPPQPTALNECGAEKCVCTSLRPCRLPHTELADLEGVAQFVSEFFLYEPLADPGRPPAHLASPWSVLEWQAGDAFDLSGLAASLLLGAGYDAAVVCGYVPREVAMGDQSRSECPWLRQHGLEAPPYAELAPRQPSWEDEALAPAPAAPADASEAAPASAEPVPGSELPAVPAPDGEAAAAPVPASRPATSGSTAASVVPSSRPTTGCAMATAPEAADTAAAPAAAADAIAPAGSEGNEAPAALVPAPRRPKRYVHALVLVRPGRRDVAAPLLLDPATGLLHGLEAAPCWGVEWAYTPSNFWVNLQQRAGGAQDEAAAAGLPPLAAPAAMNWCFTNPTAWLPLLLTREDALPEVPTVASLLTCGSKVSELMQRSGLGAAPSRPSLLASCLSLSRAAFTPRAAAASAQPGDGPAAPGAGAGAAGSPLRGGVGLANLAMGRSGTPRLGGHPPAAEAQQSSLAYLAPDESLQPLPRSSTRLSTTSNGSSPLGPPAASPLPATSPLPPASSAAEEEPRLPPPPEMPLSWVPPLALSRERLDTRCPRGERAVRYRQARRELFARFGECGRWDGLVERLTTYADAECAAPLCVLELFSQRQDRLSRRTTWLAPASRTTLSSFDSGAVSCLKSLRLAPAQAGAAAAAGGEAAAPEAQGQAELAFYAETRPDGLLRRLHRGAALEEWFLPGSRSDGLVQRTVLYANGGGAGSEAADAGGAPQHHPGRHSRASLVPAWQLQEAERPVACIVERHSWAAGSAPSAGMAVSGGVLLQRRFDLATSRLELVLRGPEGADGAPTATQSRVYDLGGGLLEAVGAPEGSSPVPPEQQRREHAALRAASLAAQAAVQAAEAELSGILQQRRQQDQRATLLAAHYDAPRLQVQDSDSEQEEEAGEGEALYDPLSFFLPRTGTRDMTAAEAEEARSRCLAAFDERTRARADLLARRLAESGAEVARLAGQLAGELSTLSPADQARLRQDAASADFRLRVVQRRMDEHAPAAAAKRRDLEALLAGDRRLAAALANSA